MAGDSCTIFISGILRERCTNNSKESKIDLRYSPVSRHYVYGGFIALDQLAELLTHQSMGFESSGCWY